MIILAQITNETQALSSIAQGVHYYLPSVSLTNIGVVLLGVSKLAQIAYKHLTTEGSKTDKLMKVIGVVQEPTVAVVADNTLKTNTTTGK